MAVIEHEPIALPKFHLDQFLVSVWSWVKTSLGLDTLTEKDEFVWQTRKQLWEVNPRKLERLDYLAQQIRSELGRK